MMKVANRGCIRRLSRKSMAAARTRNIVAVLAIALTSILFTSLFTIAAALNASTEQYNFRTAGGDIHASVKNLTWDQVEQLRSDQFLLDGDRFVQDTGTSAVMCYAFDTTDESSAAMEDWLTNYTQTVQPTLDFESKQGYAAQFEGLRNMFLAVGSALAFVIGLVGVLNFVNAILTGIITAGGSSRCCSPSA